MTDTKISQLTTYNPNNITNFYIAGTDLTQSPMNGKMNASAMLGAYFLAHGGSSNGSAGEYVNKALNISVLPNAYADTVLYTPVVSTNDVAMVTLEFGQASIIPQSFNFQIYSGIPSGSGVLVYDSYVATGKTINTASAFCNSTLYVPYAAGSNNLYIRITNAGAATLTISFQGVFLEFAGNGVALPTYVPPAPYTGALMSTVHVGPSEQFTQPIYGLQALADGGTMILDDGHYYFPIALLNTADQNITTNTYTFGGATYNVFGGTSAHASNRFTGGITIQGASGSPYACVWDGLGGIGNGFRLAEGKGLILSHVPITVSNINFRSAGGADGAGDGEAALYAENFLSTGTLTVNHCGIDNCENGLLTPDVDAKVAGVLTQNAGPGVNVSVVLNQCDFGFNAGNGVTPDGLSHNFYNECQSITLNNCHMYSAAVGNTMKCRGPSITVNNSYVEGGQGRALDQPEGGSVNFQGCILNVAPSANSPFLAYNSETTARTWRTQSNPTVNSCTLIATRFPVSQIWYNNSSGYWNFTNCTQQFFGTQAGFIPERVQSGYINDNTACQGLFLTSAQGGTTITSLPTRAASIAQPSATPTLFTAWNGTVSYIY